jgi:hypothetical protein
MLLSTMLLMFYLTISEGLPVSSYEHWSLVWASVSAISTATTLVVVIIAAIFTYAQIREASRARQLEGALAVLSHISSPELRNARRLIYSHHAEIEEIISRKPSWQALDIFFKQISDNQVGMETFHSYLASLENVAILVLHGLAPDDIIEMYFGRMAPHHWERLTKFIEFMRSYYGSDDFLQHFEMMKILLISDSMKSGREKRKLLKQRRQRRKTI